MEFVLEMIQNLLGKGENAGYFLPIANCLQFILNPYQEVGQKYIQLRLKKWWFLANLIFFQQLFFPELPKLVRLCGRGKEQCHPDTY